MKNIMFQPYVEYGQKNYIEEIEEKYIKYQVQCDSTLKFVPDGMEEVVWLCADGKITVIRPDKIYGEEIETKGATAYGIRADYGCSIEADASKVHSYTVCDRYMHPRAHEIIDTIIKTKGKVSVAELAAQYNYTVRHIGNIVQSALSCSPKYFAKIVRFQNVLGEIIANPYRNNSEFIERLSYADQAHFQREFKAVTGETPKQFINSIIGFMAKETPKT